MDEFNVDDYEYESEEEEEGPFMEDEQDLDARIVLFIEEEEWLYQLDEVERAFMEEDPELDARIQAMEDSELDIECLLEIQNAEAGVCMEDDPELEPLQCDFESAFIEDDLDVGARIRAMEDEMNVSRWPPPPSSSAQKTTSSAPSVAPRCPGVPSAGRGTMGFTGGTG